VANIVMLTDGAEGHEELGLSREAQMNMRNEESRRAAAVLGLETRFLNHLRLADSAAQATDELVRVIGEKEVEAVFGPFVLDGDPDHRTANYVLAGALKQIPWDVRVFGYEVWGLAIPNVLVVIDEVMDQKEKMLGCFTFANQALDYVHTTKGLNMYRSRLLGAGERRYPEVF